jgi:hypothetical protein
MGRDWPEIKQGDFIYKFYKNIKIYGILIIFSYKIAGFTNYIIFLAMNKAKYCSHPRTVAYFKVTRALEFGSSIERVLKTTLTIF